jgi:protein-tyrosine phosphatase
VIAWRSVIDIHSHVLWGIDDGAVTLEESQAMLEAAAGDGTTGIVATPHHNEQFAYDRAVVEERIAELAGRTPASLKVYRGCEFHMNFDNIEQLLQGPKAYTLNGSRYLLLECPDAHIGTYTESVLDRLMVAGVVPILAHPERNPQLQKSIDRLERWVELGCLVQVTSLSIIGAFGGSARAAGLRILDSGLAHVVASDAHDPEHRHTRMSQARDAVCRRLGEDAAELLFTDNPGAVVEDLPIPSGKVAVARQTRRWWPF